MVDSHCHLNFHKFSDDLDEVVQRASVAGVTKIVNVGTQISSSIEAIDISERFDSCLAVVGVHPHHADKAEKGWEDELEKLTSHNKVIAIGECGLDYFSYQSNGIVDPELQKDIFEKQIEIAYKTKLPLVIHNRLAGKDIIEILKYHRTSLLNIPGMFHCMSGDLDLLKNVLDLGFYVGYDGNITYPKLAPGESVHLTDLVRATPLDRLLIETDSPYLTPIPYRGKRNEPKNAIIIGEFIAKIKGVSFEKVEEITDQNFLTVFS